jgi:uncharacterized MAPEG superfamily protein
MAVALWCVLAARLLPVLVVFVAKSDPRLDVHNPRDVHALQTGLRKRAYGTHLNGLEAFPLFAAAVIVATLKGVPQSLLDWAAGAWLLVRLGYTAAYLCDLARIRPALWALSVILSVAIFLLPARRYLGTGCAAVCPMKNAFRGHPESLESTASVAERSM